MKVIPLTIGAWNVRTLMDSSSSDRPEQRTALVGKELGRYKVEIAALSETRLAGEGLLKEVGAGYTFFWSGRKKEERREAGVGFAIKSHLVIKLSGLPKSINDRLMTLRRPLSGKRHATIVSAYEPTMTNPDEVKDMFYDDLDSVISAAPRTDKHILLVDFNARVCTDHLTWKGVIGSEGVGKRNSNGLLLLRKCAEHELLITNTVFRLPTRRKTTWLHPRSKHRHLIDYVIVRRKDRQDVKVTKTMCGADCWTDHRLVVIKLNLRIQPVQPTTRQEGAKDIRCLQAETRQQEANIRQRSLQPFRCTVTQFRRYRWELDSLQRHRSLCSNGFPRTSISQTPRLVWWEWQRKSGTPWIETPKNTRLTSEIPAQYVARLPIQTYAKQFRRGSETCKTPGWEKRLMESLCRQNMEKFFDALKIVYGPQSSGTTPLLSADGISLLTDKEAILKRWVEHFDGVLIRPSVGRHLSMMKLSTDYNRWNVIRCLMSPNRLWNNQKAIKLLSSGKAPGSDAIPTEIYKAGGPPGAEKLSYFTLCGEKKPSLKKIKDATIIHLFKRKGNIQVCDNHRGIFLLSIAGKILVRVLLNRLNEHLEWSGLPPESQCGFRKNRGTIDMIFTARQLQDKCQEQNVDLYTTFVDLTKAFDTVSREGLWKIMAKFGCPTKFIAMVRQFHGMLERVQNDGEFSDPFPVTNGVKQGCVLGSTLFSMMFSAMLAGAFQDGDKGIALMGNVST